MMAAADPTPAHAIRRVNHIAVVVKDIEQALIPYQRGLGLVATPVEYVPGFDVKVCFLPIGDTQIELVQPMGREGELVDFLRTTGGAGLHHIAVETGDIGGALARMTAAGVPMRDPQPRPGAHGSTVAFAERRGFDGVVIELVEPAADGHVTSVHVASAGGLP
jgi:methylmalonyl-CoA epimerase